eukprot:TRINITY_DN13302_c0_g2_i1.p1 TRINITY_DN13302_c0_g2~~TRINITY_DN13302_c0_g2_i1.p1  ORF type:complete len:127 (-),score=28.40 TRINITY_DN13302_c0_g2_i1:93-473(-)
MLLINSGAYQTFNDNIVLAICELPDIERIGPCLLLAYGGKVKGELEEVMKREEMSLSKVVEIEEERLEDQRYADSTLTEIYKWIVETHESLTPNFKLDNSQRKDLYRELSRRIRTRSDERPRCTLI